MTEKEFLSLAWQIDERIEARIDECARLRGRLEAGRSANYSGMPRGGSGDWTDAIDTVIEMERTIRKEIKELCRVKRAVNDAIAAVEVVKFKTVLELRYRNYLQWEEIADKLGYELRNVFKLHGRALLKVKIPEEFQDAEPEKGRHRRLYRKRNKEEQHVSGRS